ncbi:MAG: hypothetical protein U9Q68_05020 [Euryarchaeota archaeon]|nr:hypothetical protein [Euryarchaeota archaeon]
MAKWDDQRVNYGIYYFMMSVKTPSTLATIASIAVTIFTSVALGLSPLKHSVVMFVGIIVLYSLAMFVIGISNYKKDINIPLLITSNIPPLDALKDSMKRHRYTPWRINVLKREFGPSAFREDQLTTVKISPQLINCRDDIRAIARTIREKIHIIGKELIGLNNVTFHLYVTEEIPTTIALMVGILLGDEHANFTIYTSATQNQIERILDSEEIIGTKTEENQISDIPKLNFITNIYNKAGKLEKENLSLDDAIELVRTEFNKFILMVDLTPSPLNIVPISNFIKNTGIDCDGFMVATTKSKINGLFTFNELQYLTTQFSYGVSEIVKEGLNADGRIVLALKAPHPLNIAMGYKLWHQPDLRILHYNRREGKYIEPILLKEIFAVRPVAT